MNKSLLEYVLFVPGVNHFLFDCLLFVDVARLAQTKAYVFSHVTCLHVWSRLQWTHAKKYAWPKVRTLQLCSVRGYDEWKWTCPSFPMLREISVFQCSNLMLDVSSCALSSLEVCEESTGVRIQYDPNTVRRLIDPNRFPPITDFTNYTALEELHAHGNLPEACANTLTRLNLCNRQLSLGTTQIVFRQPFPNLVTCVLDSPSVVFASCLERLCTLDVSNVSVDVSFLSLCRLPSLTELSIQGKVLERMELLAPLAAHSPIQKLSLFVWHQKSFALDPLFSACFPHLVHLQLDLHIRELVVANHPRLETLDLCVRDFPKLDASEPSLPSNTCLLQNLPCLRSVAIELLSTETICSARSWYAKREWSHGLRCTGTPHLSRVWITPNSEWNIQLPTLPALEASMQQHYWIWMMRQYMVWCTHSEQELQIFSELSKGVFGSAEQVNEWICTHWFPFLEN